MTESICKGCGQFKELYAKGFCRKCYDKQYMREFCRRKAVLHISKETRKLLKSRRQKKSNGNIETYDEALRRILD